MKQIKRKRLTIFVTDRKKEGELPFGILQVSLSTKQNETSYLFKVINACSFAFVLKNIDLKLSSEAVFQIVFE